MELSSREANKLLRELCEDLRILEEDEDKCQTTTISSDQNLEDWRPKYDYEETKQKVSNLKKQIRTLKHAINLHNTTTVVPELDMTIDEVLVYLPQLTAQRSRLNQMRKASDCVRSHSGYSELVDYTYLNYDKAQVNRDYKAVSTRLNQAQNALDKINVTDKFTVEL